MQLTFTKQTALGIGAFLIVVATLAFAWFTIPRPLPDPSRFLPGEETIAFFGHVTKENSSVFSTAFPMLAGVPLSDIDASVAFVNTGSGRIAWVLLEPTPGEEEPFRIRASLPEAVALLSHVEHPLNRDYRFGMVQPEPDDKGPWAFLRFPQLTLNAASPAGTVFVPDRPVGIAALQDGLRIRFGTVQKEDRFAPLTEGPQDIFAEPLFVLHASNVSQMLTVTRPLLTPETALVSETTLRRAIVALFGTDISPAYDLQPFLEGQTSVHTSLDPDTQNLRVVLEGDLRGRADDMKRLSDLFRATQGAFTVESPVFDDKFTLPNVRKDLSILEDTSGTASGWNIRTVRQKESGKGLWIGLRGGRYVISNDETGFAKALTAPSPALSTLDQAPFALGILQSKEVGNWLTRTLPTVWPSAAIPSGTGGYLKWKMTQEGGRITVLFKKV